MPAQGPQRFRIVLPEAEFSYSLDQGILKIVDLSLGADSVTNDAEKVLRKIAQRHPGSISDYRVMYRDSLGIWDGIDWDGRETRFFLIREINEQAAERKLQQLRPPLDGIEPLS
jgi:hypothetical protein